MYEDEIKNPFGDPLAPVTTVSSTVPMSGNRVVTAGLGDYNPFEMRAGNLVGQMDSAPPVPPPFPVNGAENITTAELERRQRELQAKAQELDRREREQNDLNYVRVNNWPPLCSCCPCKPCFFQDIDLEINPVHAKLVKYALYWWGAYSITLIANVIGGLIVLVGSSDPTGGVLFGLSIIHMVIWPSLSYMFWFRPVYRAFRDNSSVFFFIFFIVSIFQCFLLAIQAIGIPSWGYCGWLTFFAVLKSSSVVAVFVFFIAAMFTALTVTIVIYLTKVHQIYRNSGASFEKAREEFSKRVYADPLLRSATAEAGLFAVRQTVGVSNPTAR